MTCTDWGVWIFVGLLIIGLPYQIYSDIRFRRKQNELRQRLIELEKSEWPVK